jgi:Holliday junction resolvasome RuvABC endonuclease subunit
MKSNTGNGLTYPQLPLLYQTILDTEEDLQPIEDDRKELWVGVVPSSDKVHVVVVEFSNDLPALLRSERWPIAQGNKPSAYQRLHEQFSTFIQEGGFDTVVIKSSAVPRAFVTLAHFETAEVRGVLMSAAVQANVDVQMISSAEVGRNFGKKTFDGYVDDDSFWMNNMGEDLSKETRRTILLVFHARKKQRK